MVERNTRLSQEQVAKAMQVQILSPTPYKMRDKDKLRKYQREWMAKRRSDFFAGKSCVGCGATDNLELDHVDPSQKEDHKVWSWRQERREQEIAKCLVRCHACHVARHRSLNLAPCGTTSAYRRGCRCIACRRANANRRARQRQYRGC